jgi:hypothetical protein
MPLLSVKRLVFGAGLLALACAIMGAIVSLNSPSLMARWRWERSRPPHYEMDILWIAALGQGRVRVEVRDGHAVAATDLYSGIQLVAFPLDGAPFEFELPRPRNGNFVTADELFDLIAAYRHVSKGPGDHLWYLPLARYVPPLRSRMIAYSCKPSPPRVQYDPLYGYPARVTLPGSHCRQSFNDRIDMEVTRFQPLP